MPEYDEFCLLELKDGRMAGGRWDWWRDKKGGQFIYASALSSFDMKEVWAWTPLSSDDIFEREEERERERKHEEELNRNPFAEPEKFKFLDRYLETVPARSFGLGKEDFLPDKKLKKFLGYR